MSEFFSSLCATNIFVIVAIAFLGYLIGGITIKGVEIGTAGVLLVALVFGHFSSQFGFEVPSIVTTIGTVLFVGAVGFIAGPNFFRNFKKNAKSYILLGFIVVLTGAVVAVAVIKIFDIPSALASGMLTGALTSTPGLSAATDAAKLVSAEAEKMVAVGYGVAYPFGVIGVVLFVQLVPKFLKVDMEKERCALRNGIPESAGRASGNYLKLDPLGMFPFFMALALGVILGKITIPLPGGAAFSLGTTGGPLIAGLVIAHYGHCGKISLDVDKNALKTFRELGLCLFLIGAGFKGGNGFVQIVSEYGAMLFVYGAIMTIIPMVVGFIVSHYLLKLCLLNNLGSICGGMTSTPALGTLISVSGSDDVASAYAATYPVALVCVVLCAQFIVMLF